MTADMDKNRIAKLNHEIVKREMAYERLEKELEKEQRKNTKLLKYFLIYSFAIVILTIADMVL